MAKCTYERAIELQIAARLAKIQSVLFYENINPDEHEKMVKVAIDHVHNHLKMPRDAESEYHERKEYRNINRARRIKRLLGDHYVAIVRDIAVDIVAFCDELEEHQCQPLQVSHPDNEDQPFIICLNCNYEYISNAPDHEISCPKCHSQEWDRNDDMQ